MKIKLAITPLHWDLIPYKEVNSYPSIVISGVNGGITITETEYKFLCLLLTIEKKSTPVVDNPVENAG